MSQAIKSSSHGASSRAVYSGARAHATSLMALEPRMLFDGAIGATADAALDLVELPTSNEPAQPAEVSVLETPAYEAPQEAAFLVVAKTDNHAPVANDDARSAPHDSGPLTGNIITAGQPGEVADFDPDGDDFAVFGVTTGATDQVPLGHVGTPVEGQFGTLVLFADGSYTYTPNDSVAALAPGESAQDVFSCLVCDDVGNTDTSTLTFDFANAAVVPGDPGNPADPGGPGDPVIPDPGQPADPGDPGGGGNEPPVFVAPPDQQPTFPVPLPPDTNQGSTEPAPVVSDGTVNADSGGNATALGSPYTLLSPESGAPASALSTDAFAPFAPAAVLGMVETAPDRDNGLAKLGVAPVSMADTANESKGEQACAQPKPNVVSRTVEGAQAKVFTDTVRGNAKPIPAHQGNGQNC
ncbi:MAG: Ig-like domain-containing protein [Burkholderiaceae bacterium]